MSVETTLKPLVYEPLQADEIRVFVLHPSKDKSARIEGRFETHNLRDENRNGRRDDTKRYSALSWVWGNASPTIVIGLGNSHSAIRHNLGQALLNLRHNLQERRLWVDALCINVNDSKEKAFQISIMHRIFAQAEDVIVWLGEGKSNASDTLPAFLEDIHSALRVRGGRRTITKRYDISQVYKNLDTLTSSPWFRRAWTLQETLLANRLDFHFGQHRLSPEHLKLAFTLYGERFSSSNLVLMYSTLEPSEKFTITASLHPTRIDLACREAVYHKVFWRMFYQHLLQLKRSLDVLLWPWKRELPLPPWIYSANNHPSAKPIVQVWDPLNELRPVFRFRPFNGYKTMQVNEDCTVDFEGYIIDCVEDTSDIHVDQASMRGIFPETWMNFGTMKRLVAMVIPEYERTLSFDEQISLTRELESFLFRLHDKHRAMSYFTEHKGFFAFVEKLKILTRGRRLFKTSRKSQLGLGPAGVRKRDVICFAPGCSAPIVLRPIERPHDQGFDSREDYAFIGACYMGKYMNQRNEDDYLTTIPLRKLRLFPVWKCGNVHESYECNADSTARLEPASTHSDKTIDIAGEEAEKNLPTSEDSEQSKDSIPVTRGFKMLWQCTCGHKGLDYYTEHRRGSVKELLESLQRNGHTASLEPWDPLQPSQFATTSALTCFGNSTNNLWIWLIACIHKWVQRKQRLPQLEGIATRGSLRVTGDGRTDFKPATRGSSSKQSAQSSSSSSNVLPSAPRDPNIGALWTTGRSSQGNSSLTNGGHSSTMNRGSLPTNITIPENFVLLCMRVRRYLTTRHDLGVSDITCDRELFEAFRARYNSKFRWAYRRFSLRTAQRMSFVKFNLHPRYEVDGLVTELPPETVGHYTCDPRKPDRIPALGSDFLMHRFTAPNECYHDDICFRQVPKRVGERPTPGLHPDLNTGWGLHIEEDLDLQRICLILFFGIASAGTFGLTWGICKHSLQDGFAIASFIMGSEAVAVATMQLLLAFGTM